MISIQTANLSVIPGQIRHNYENMIKEINIAKENHADIIIFPELTLTGYFIGDLWEQPSFLRECDKYKEKIVSASQDIIIIFGHIAIDETKKNTDGRYRKYNAAFIAKDGKLLKNDAHHLYTIKTLLPTYRQFDDPRHFTSLLTVALEENTTVENLIAPYTVTKRNETIRIGLLLCEDSWDENYSISPSIILTEKKSDILINISASPFSLGKNQKRHRLFHEQGQNHHTPTLYINRQGVENTGKTIYMYDGITSAYDQKGNNIHETTPFLTARTRWTFNNEAKTLIISEKRTYSETNLLTPLQYGLSEFLKAIHIDHVTIGISGGIDSAVNAALFRSILPKENILLVNTPTKFNSLTTRTLAKELADRLETYYTEIPITHFINETISTLQNKTISTKTTETTLSLSNLAIENIQARDRSSRILTGLSSAFGGIFTCNANKTELTIGYGTLYGDLTGALSATGDLWKHQIYQLGRELNAHFQTPVIPEKIFTIKPSAELSENQDINKNLGDPLIYEYHDYLFRTWTESWNRTAPEEILQWYHDNTLEEKIGTPLSVHKLFPTPIDFIKDLEKWWNLYAGFAVAKRIQSPPILAISRRPYGTDLRESQLSPYYTDRYVQLKNELLK